MEEELIGGKYKKGLTIGCVLILIGVVLSLVIYPWYSQQLYDLSRRRAEKDMDYEEYNLKRNEISLYYGYLSLICKGIITVGCFLGVFTCITLFFDRKTPLQATERLGLLILSSCLLLIALWFSIGIYQLIPPIFY